MVKRVPCEIKIDCRLPVGLKTTNDYFLKVQDKLSGHSIIAFNRILIWSPFNLFIQSHHDH